MGTEATLRGTAVPRVVTGMAAATAEINPPGAAAQETMAAAVATAEIMAVETPAAGTAPPEEAMPPMRKRATARTSAAFYSR